MARSNIPMVINLRQNKNDDSTAYGKFFAEVDSKEPLSLKGFAKHMGSARETRRSRHVQPQRRRPEVGQEQRCEGCGGRP